MKVCPGCAVAKPLSEFHKNRAKANGHRSRCKICTNRNDRASRAANPEGSRALWRAYDAANRDKRRAQKRRYYAANREKSRARNILGMAVASGIIVRQPCEICATTENLKGHHPDYSKPLEVRWLCSRHHGRLTAALARTTQPLLKEPNVKARAKLIAIVESARGDDLERAKRAWENLPTAMLDTMHGESGQTKRQILAGYYQARLEWKAARTLLLGLLEGEPNGPG